MAAEILCMPSLVKLEDRPVYYFYCGICSEYTRFPEHRSDWAGCKHCHHSHKTYYYSNRHGEREADCGQCLMFLFTTTPVCWSCNKPSDISDILHYSEGNDDIVSEGQKCPHCSYKVDSAWVHKWSCFLLNPGAGNWTLREKDHDITMCNVVNEPILTERLKMIWARNDDDKCWEYTE